jgi:hypothetical protein
MLSAAVIECWRVATEAWVLPTVLFATADTKADQRVSGEYDLVHRMPMPMWFENFARVLSGAIESRVE